MNFIIAAEAAQNTMTGLEKLGLGGRTLLIGLVMVFVVLGILIGLVSLNKVILPKIEKGYNAIGEKLKARKAKRKAAKAAKKAGMIEEAPKAKALPAAAPAPVAQPVAVSNDEEVVAAITAALSLYYEQQMVSTGKTVKFRVRSIKEIR